MTSKDELLNLIEHNSKKVLTDSQKEILKNYVLTGIKPKDPTTTEFRNFYGLNGKLKKAYKIATGLEELGLIKLKNKKDE